MYLNGSLYDARAAAEAGYPTMTTLAHRYRKGYFVVSGPDTQPTRFRSRREAKDWEKHTASLGRPSMRSAPRTNMTDDQRRSVYIITIAGVLVIAAVMFKWLA